MHLIVSTAAALELYQSCLQSQLNSGRKNRMQLSKRLTVVTLCCFIIVVINLGGIRLGVAAKASIGIVAEPISLVV